MGPERSHRLSPLLSRPCLYYGRRKAQRLDNDHALGSKTEESFTFRVFFFFCQPPSGLFSSSFDWLIYCVFSVYFSTFDYYYFDQSNNNHLLHVINIRSIYFTTLFLFGSVFVYLYSVQPVVHVIISCKFSANLQT